MTQAGIARRSGLLGTWPFGEDLIPASWRDLFGHSLRVEEKVEDRTYVVRVEAPGIDPGKDVAIDVADGILTIGVERRAEKREEDEGRYRSEFSYGSFRRSLTLPTAAAADDVKATYEDGILEVRVPVGEPPAPPRRIEVTRV
jgi:HSP20 family protein